MFSLICVWINDWVNNREAGDLRRHRAHHDVILMCIQKKKLNIQLPQNALLHPIKQTWTIQQIQDYWNHPPDSVTVFLGKYQFTLDCAKMKNLGHFNSLSASWYRRSPQQTCKSMGPFCYNGVTFYLSMDKESHASKMSDEITYPLPRKQNQVRLGHG